MSHLPERGDVLAAVEKLDARVHAIGGGDMVECGPIDTTGADLTGVGVDPLLRAYGDLFDPGEFLSDVGFLLIGATLFDIRAGRDVSSALTSMLLQAAALGVLMERARWERRP